MKLSSGWEQSVYVLLILARLPENRTMSSIALANRLKVSPSYLKKIIKSLVDEGLLRSTPGKNGGFSLNKDLHDISFYDVFWPSKDGVEFFKVKVFCKILLVQSLAKQSVVPLQALLMKLKIHLSEHYQMFH